MLAALQDGSLKAYQLFRDGRKEKLIPRSQWRSLYFKYDLLSSEILEQIGHHDDDWIISDCYLRREDIRSFLVELYGEQPELPRRGPPSIMPQILQQLHVRAREKDMKKDIGLEADELRKWAQDKLVPQSKSIANKIGKDHARLVVQNFGSAFKSGAK